MIYKILRFIQLWLPFWFILWLYKSDQALPANIKTRTGRNLKAIMITTEYGLIFAEEVYNKNRLKLIKQKQQEVAQLNDELIAEINNLSFAERELLINGTQEDDEGR